MASFGGVNLDNGGCAVFELASKSTDDLRQISLELGAEAVIPAAAEFVVIRGMPGVTYEEVHQVGARLAAQGLDLMHSELGAPLLLNQDDSPHVVVWGGANERSVRIVAKARSQFRFQVQVEVRDSTGTLVLAQPAAAKPWHPSMRYYRIAESSTDLFDSFRNTYLALESLLSTVVPPRTGNAAKRPPCERLRSILRRSNTLAASAPEREGAWLKRALREVSQTADLSAFAPAGSSKASANAIFEDIYTIFRTATFHAKTDRHVLTPQEQTARQELIDARVRAADLYRALAFTYLSSRYDSSNLSEAAYRTALDILGVDPQVYVSEDQTPVASEPDGQYQLAPAGGAHFLFRNAPHVDSSRSATLTLLGSSQAVVVRSVLREVHRFGVFRNGTHAMVESLKAGLNLDGIDDLELEFIVGGRGHGTPRRDFES